MINKANQLLYMAIVQDCKETVLSAGTVVVANKSVEGVRTKPLFQVLVYHGKVRYIYLLYCDVFMMQLKFYSCHVKPSEI